MKKTALIILIISILLIVSSYVSFKFNLDYYACRPYYATDSWLEGIFSLNLKQVELCGQPAGNYPSVIYMYLAYAGIILLIISVVLLIKHLMKKNAR